MKLTFPATALDRGRSRRTSQGFTLPEVLIAMTVFLLILAGIISANLFGLKMFQVNQAKLKATEWSRTTFGKLSDEVRVCDAVFIGNVNTNGLFTGLLNGQTQQGNGLLIYPTTNTAKYIVYFVKTADQTFRRATEQPGTAIILGESVTNTMIFKAQNFSGNVLTNAQNNRVIHLTLEFYQPERFMQRPDYYKLETAMTRRAIH